MRGVSVIVVLIGFAATCCVAQYLNNRPYPTYSLEQMPDTDFSCRDKILGGYYADAQTQCQMFHVCVKVAGVGIQDFRFLCPNGTAFDQDHQICADWDDVDCDATTLYYSSDNFDLYRIGSGFESKAVKYGEEEEAFALQRAETGDLRLNKEHQTQRVNQQKENVFKPRPNQQQNNRNNYNNNNNNNNNNNERDIFKGSSSSNFFNNRNGGKETEDDEEDGNVNANQNDDRYQRRKNARRQQNRKPEYEEEQTQKPNRPTGFSNNFAGSSYVPTSTTARTINEQRPRQRGRVNPQYNNADSFRHNSGGGRNYDDGQYRPDSFTVSTPAPFKQTQQYTTTLAPKPTTTRPTENYPSNFPQQKYTSQYRETENYPNKKTENYPTSTKEAENYPATHNTQQQYEATKIKTDNYPAQKKPTTPFKQQDNYPTTFSPKTNPFKHSEAYTTLRSNQQNIQTNNGQYTPSSNYDNKQSTQYTPSTNYNAQYNYDNNKQNSQAPNYNKPNTQYTPTTNFDSKPNSQAPNTQYTPTTNFDNKSNSQATNYNNPNSQYTPTAINFNKPNTQYTPTTNYDNKQSTQHTNYDKQNTQYTPSTNYNTQSTNYNTQSTNFNTQSTNYNQQDSSRSTFSQNLNNNKTPQYNNPTTQQKQTTQFTQYTPTVPRITTPYYSSTTPSNSRRSNRFDETQYDDGSYNAKYEEGTQGRDDEFLKTAHSTNIASSRNEYIQNHKNAASQVSSTQKPRPFSVTPNSPKVTDFPKVTQYAKQQQQTTSPQHPVTPSAVKAGQPNKKTKDVSYDYAYYDTNAGNDHEYDLGDIEKSDKIKNKKQ